VASLHLRKWISFLAGVAAGVSFFPMAARAQCPLCYMSAASSGSKGIEALKHGILILLVPTLVLFGSVLWLALRRRNGPETSGLVALPPDSDEESFPPLPASRDRHSPSRA
jgi:hypothetical protein